MSGKKPTHMVRVYDNTYHKLRTLADIKDTSIIEVLSWAVDDYMERSITSPEQEAMWKIMSAKVTLARKRKS